tara:strand:- start:376 stop:585 length:210 start_codon:yes stop_codon:yes gene_type:complete
MEELKKYVEDYKYFVIDHEGNYTAHSSLRKMATALSVDHTTISKKLKEDGHYYFVSKKTKNPFYITKLQ